MTSAGHFNVTAAGAIVLGGIAAFLLATVVALSGYGHPDRRATSVSAPRAVPSTAAAAGAPPETEVEYLLDTSEPTSTPGRRTP